MLLTSIQRFLLMVLLVAAQILVFNHIHLFGYATPLPFVYLLLTFPLGTQRWNILLWGFICGLLADTTMLTPGVGAFSMTLTAFVQPLLLNLLAPKDASEDMQPSYNTMSLGLYARYAAILTLIFTATYFLVLSFSFQHLSDLALSFASSWVLTYLLCLVFEGFRKKKYDE